jgi:26S proteasome regulatory subunit N2
VEEKKEEAKKRVETVTLSTTAKEKARLARKKAKMGEKDAEEGKETSQLTPEPTPKTEGEGEAMDIDKAEDSKTAEEETAKPKKKREPEPSSFRVGNPSRITLAQSKLCEFDMNQRYRPIRFNETPMGVVILIDSTPQDIEEELGTVKSPSLEPEGELAPPEPFEWTPPSDLADSGASTASSE